MWWRWLWVWGFLAAGVAIGAPDGGAGSALGRDGGEVGREVPLSLVTRSPDGDLLDGSSTGSDMSADGRYIVFGSDAQTLVADDPNPGADVFWHDRLIRETRLVSRRPAPTAFPEHNYDPSISANGQRVAFSSYGSSLVPQPTAEGADVFAWDAATGLVQLVSTSADGTPGNGYSEGAHISGDGRFVAFSSAADNLVPGDFNETLDVFVKELASGAIERISVDSSELGLPSGSGGAISHDGRFVVFGSSVQRLDKDEPWSVAVIYLRDRQSGTTTLVTSVDGAIPQADSYFAFMTPDARKIGFSTSEPRITGRPGTESEPVIWDRLTGQFELASLPGQAQANERVSARYSGDLSKRLLHVTARDWSLPARIGTYVQDVATGEVTQLNLKLPFTPAGPMSTRRLSHDGTLVLVEGWTHSVVGQTDYESRSDVYIGEIEPQPLPYRSRIPGIASEGFDLGFEGVRVVRKAAGHLFIVDFYHHVDPDEGGPIKYQSIEVLGWTEGFGGMVLAPYVAGRAFYGFNIKTDLSAIHAVRLCFRGAAFVEIACQEFAVSLE